MTWSYTADVLAMASMLAGASLCLVAGIGLVRLPDTLTRMHAATKPQVLGLLLVLAGAGLRLRNVADVGTLALVVLFQLLTVPVAAQMVGRAAYRTGKVDREHLVVDELASPPDKSPAERAGSAGWGDGGGAGRPHDAGGPDGESGPGGTGGEGGPGDAGGPDGPGGPANSGGEPGGPRG